MPKKTGSITKTTALRMALEAHADVEDYGEGTVTITGPVHLEQAAETFAHLLKVAVDA